MKAARAPTRSSLALAAVLAVTLGVAGLALAQGPTSPAVDVRLAQGDVPVDAGNATLVEATVRNTGPVDGAVTLATGSLDGWTVDADAGSFPLASGEERVVTLTVTAPGAGAGAAGGDVPVTVTIVDALGRTASAEAALAVTRVDPPVPPAGVDPLLVAGGVFLAVAAAGGVGAGVAKRRRRLAREREERAFLDRETGVTVATADGPIDGAFARDVSYRLAVVNESARPRVAVLRVESKPDGWLAALSVSTVELAAGERAIVTLTVTPAPDAPVGGEGDVVVSARPEEARERDERVTVRVRAGRPRAFRSAPPKRAVLDAKGAARGLLRP